MAGPRGENGELSGHLRAVPVVRHLRRRGRTRISTLARELAVPQKTLAKTVAFLEGEQVIGKDQGQIWLHPKLGYLAGVDVTERTATVAITPFDFRDPIIASREIPIESPEESLRLIAKLVADELKDHVGEARIKEKLIGIGLTLPGPILRSRNPDRPVMKQAADWDRRPRSGLILPGWDEVNVAGKLATLLKDEHGILPPRHDERRFVWIENDASAGALGVHTEMRLGLGDKAPDDLIYVRMTRGIGAGIINKGHLLTGAYGFAGELGHITVDPTGSLCPACGGRGCLETVASDRAIADQLRGVIPKAHDLQFSSMLEAAHPAVDRAVRDAGRHVGMLLAQVCCFLNPSHVVLSGAQPEYKSQFERDHNGDPVHPFVNALKDALELYATPQALTGDAEDSSGPPILLENIKTWSEVSYEQTLSPELLGALALVIDHLGDAYLLKPIERWIGSTEARQRPLTFS